MTTADQPALWAPEPLTHLRLQRQLPQGRRAPAAPARGGPTKYPDQKAHGAALSARALALRAIHAQRVPVLGVAPDLVMVLHVDTPPKPESLRNAGLDVVDYLTDRVVVSAERDTQLTAFSAMLADYQTGPRPPLEPSTEPAVTDEGSPAMPDQTVRSAPNQAMFDCIDSIEPFGAADVLTDDLAEHLAAVADTDPVLVDAQLWCPEDVASAENLADRVAAAVEGPGAGRVLDRTLRYRAGLSVIRLEAPAMTVRSLGGVRGVRRLDRLPRALLGYGQSIGLGISALPPVLPPRSDAPLVAVIDSGVRSAHPLIGPAVQDVVALTPDGDGADEHGHGTAVASLALLGSIEPLLADGAAIRPVGRLVSIRILDHTANFPNAALWEGHLLDALELAANLGARVVNLSIGDPRRPYRPNRPTPLGAALDEFIRRRRIVVFVSAGNYPFDTHYGEPLRVAAYPQDLLDDPDAGVLDPASSALALTVGALCADDEQGFRRLRERVDTVPVGGQDWPSPATRIGPGAAHMIKPELALPGGGATVDDLTGRLVPNAGVIAAEGARSDRLFCAETGTSFAAPLATHCALRVLAANPDVGAEAVRALVLASTEPDRAADIFVQGHGTAAHRNARQRLAGYGRPDATRAASSGPHRAVLIAEETIPLDNVHLYRVPVPTTFFDSSGWRRLTVALAFSPVTRSTRLDYLGSCMSFEVYRGVSLEDVAQAYVRDERSDIDDLDPVEPADASTGETGDGVSAPDAETLGPTSIRPRALELEPGSKRRSAGANQVGTKVFKQVLDSAAGLDFVVAVRNVNRWSPLGPPESYALAVVLERDEGHQQLYAELRAELEQQLLVTNRQRLDASTIEAEFGR